MDLLQGENKMFLALLVLELLGFVGGVTKPHTEKCVGLRDPPRPLKCTGRLGSSRK